ncbi:MAG: HAD family hydrolase [Clostridiales bacterium]|nr:HAD family hydrolase [Clostridiales bacterium]
MSSDIEAVVFSFYGTLADIRTNEGDPLLWKGLSDYYATRGAFFSPEGIRNLFAREVEKERSRVRELHPVRKYIDADLIRVFDAIYKKGGIGADMYDLKDTARYFREKSTISLDLFDGADDLLDMILDKDRKIYIMSNGQASFAEVDMRALGIEDLFDGKFFSSAYNVCKPDPDFYDILLKETGVDPKRMIMVGNDLEADINGAKEAGIRSVFLNRTGEEPGTPVFAELIVKNGDLNEVTSYLEDIL